MRNSRIFNDTNVWEFREYMIDLNQSDPDDNLVDVINQIGSYHNLHRASQLHYQQIATPIASVPIHNVIPWKCMYMRNPLESQQQCRRPTEPGRLFCPECLSDPIRLGGKTSHYAIPAPIPKETHVALPAPIPVNPLGPGCSIETYVGRNHEDLLITLGSNYSRQTRG